MLRDVDSLRCTCYMDGNTSECHYRFCIYGDYSPGYAAFRTVYGLKSFMRNYGLTIDKSSARIIDMRDIGRGRFVVFNFISRHIHDVYFWHKAEVPVHAEPFIGLENGNYVTLYAIRGDNETIIYRPNSNAKEVYRPLDYAACSRIYG